MDYTVFISGEHVHTHCTIEGKSSLDVIKNIAILLNTNKPIHFKQTNGNLFLLPTELARQCSYEVSADPI